MSWDKRIFSEPGYSFARPRIHHCIGQHTRINNGIQGKEQLLKVTGIWGWEISGGERSLVTVVAKEEQGCSWVLKGHVSLEKEAFGGGGRGEGRCTSKGPERGRGGGCR